MLRLMSAVAFNRALDALNVYQGDPVAIVDEALADSPAFAMGHVLRGYLFGLATEPEATAEARSIVEQLRGLDLGMRERSHLGALEAVTAGNWTEAAERLNRHNADYPRDLLGLQAGHLMDFYRANARNLRDRIARVLPHWSPDLPGYPILLGMHAFGLEETGDYARAEDFGRRAVSLDPRDCWAHHAVAHVMEMQGRAEDGIGWMIARETHWADDGNFFKVHNWWHRSLYHLDLGQADEVLRLYDGPIRGGRSPVALDLVDASAILWRLHLSGHDVGDRWAEAADGLGCACRRADLSVQRLARRDGLSRRRADRRRRPHRRGASRGEGRPAEVAEWGRRTALPLVEGFVAFWRGDYATAVAKLHGARFIANSFGGSHAQRDIIDWTLTEAAIRGGMAGMAEALANERVALKPHSPVNRDFLGRARLTAACSSRPPDADISRELRRCSISPHHASTPTRSISWSRPSRATTRCAASTPRMVPIAPTSPGSRWRSEGAPSMPA